jgi:hypothetical protein
LLDHIASESNRQKARSQLNEKATITKKEMMKLIQDYWSATTINDVLNL